MQLAPSGEKTGQEHKVKVLVFGSYMLGVHFPSTDIDAICLFPGYVSRSDFFEDFIK